MKNLLPGECLKNLGQVWLRDSELFGNLLQTGIGSGSGFEAMNITALIPYLHVADSIYLLFRGILSMRLLCRAALECGCQKSLYY